MATLREEYSWRRQIAITWRHSGAERGTYDSVTRAVYTKTGKHWRLAESSSLAEQICSGADDKAAAARVAMPPPPPCPPKVLPKAGIPNRMQTGSGLSSGEPFLGPPQWRSSKAVEESRGAAANANAEAEPTEEKRERADEAAAADHAKRVAADRAKRVAADRAMRAAADRAICEAADRAKRVAADCAILVAQPKTVPWANGPLLVKKVQKATRTDTVSHSADIAGLIAMVDEPGHEAANTAFVMRVAREAAEDAMRTIDRPYSSCPLVESRVTPEVSDTEDEEHQPTSQVGTEQAAAISGEGSGSGTAAAVVGMHKGDAQKSGLMTVVNIRADASSAADPTVDKRELLTNLDSAVPDNLGKLDQLESVLPSSSEQDMVNFLHQNHPQCPPPLDQSSLSLSRQSGLCHEQESSLNDAHHMASCESLFEPGSSQRISSPHHPKEAMKSRQTSTHCALNRVLHPKISKDKSSRASHQGSGTAGAVGKRPGSTGAAGKRPDSAAACGQAAVKLSQAEVRRPATASEDDELANRNFSDKGEQQPAQPTQQRAQPSANVYSDATTKKRKNVDEAVAHYGTNSNTNESTVKNPRPAKTRRLCSVKDTGHLNSSTTVAGASCPAGPLGYLLQSGNNLTAPVAAPTASIPSASLLTESQHKANNNMKKALHAAAKLKGVRLSLKAAYVHAQEAASQTVAADTNSDKCLASVQSAFHAVEAAARAHANIHFSDSFLEQAYGLLIDKLRAACQLRLRLAERMMARSTKQHATTEQESEWKQRGLWASKLQAGFCSKEGALHRTALNSKLGTVDERLRIREVITHLQSEIPHINSTALEDDLRAAMQLLSKFSS